eukprot:38497-Amphidinium_carterae.1
MASSGAKKGKGKGGGPRLALPTLSGGITLANLVTIRNSLNVGLGSQTLKDVFCITFTVHQG